MSTTIAKAFGNLEQTPGMKERKRNRQARTNSVPSTQPAPVATHTDEFNGTARVFDTVEVQQSDIGGVRQSVPLKRRGYERRSQQDPRAYFSDQMAVGRTGQSRARGADSHQGQYHPAQNYNGNTRNGYAPGADSYRSQQPGSYQTPLPHHGHGQSQRRSDNRVNQPQPQQAVQPAIEPRRVVKSNGKMLRLPVNRMRAKNMITLDQPRSMLAEQYRAIRMALMGNAQRPSADGMRPRSNLLMVTSALAGEGKTYTSTNLALSISMEQDKTVLLVDADSSKGSLSRLLGVPKGTPGLMDVLMDDNLNIEDVILKTDVPRFMVIPRGTPNEYATDLFSGQKMQNLLFELSTRYDNRIVMLDTSPLLMTTEARAMANFVDQIPFVVGAEKTTHESVEESLSYLSPEKYVGLILNMATKQTRAKYGYY